MPGCCQRTSFSFSSNITATNTVFIICKQNGASFTVSDSLGNASTLSGTAIGGNEGIAFAIPITTGGADTFTFSNAACQTIAAFEESGVGIQDAALAQTNSSSMPITAGPVTTSQPDFILGGILLHTGTLGTGYAASGYTVFNNGSVNNAIVLMDQVTSASGSYGITISATGQSGNADGFVWPFKLQVNSGQTGDLVDYQSYLGSKIASIGPSGTFYPAGLGQIAASQMGGTCVMSSSTSCTLTIGHTYTTPVCIATQQSGTLTGAAVGCTVSGVTVTVTAATTNSETWGVLVFGNPN